MHRLHRMIAVAALASLSTFAGAAPYSGLYVFGDSLSDAGNVALAVGADPSQVVTGNGYIPSRPYASGQFTNGDVWVKPFAGALGLAAAALPSLLGGTDFAFGGARTATDGPGLPPSLQAQESGFLALSGGVAPSGGLYVIAGGGNDARDALAAAAASPTPAAVIGAAAAAYAQGIGLLVDALQAAGGIDIVVWNVPNLGLAPAVQAQGAGASFLGSQVATAMNAALQARLAFENEVAVFDLYGLQNSFAAAPASFGLSNVADACGAVPTCTPSSFLFLDGIHPTAAGHALIARAMLSVVAVSEPGTQGLMLAGMALLLLQSRRGRQQRRG